MTTLYCIKLNKELEGLERAPYPGELGKKILSSVSKEAWQMWLDHQTMLINENNLNLFEESSQKYLKDQKIEQLKGDRLEVQARVEKIMQKITVLE